MTKRVYTVADIMKNRKGEIVRAYSPRWFDYWRSRDYRPWAVLYSDGTIKVIAK